MNLTMQQGLRFNRSFRFQKFNYATGRIEAVDITGHEYEFSIYEPVERQEQQAHRDVKGPIPLTAGEVNLCGRNAVVVLYGVEHP